MSYKKRSPGRPAKYPPEFQRGECRLRGVRMRDQRALSSPQSSQTGREMAVNHGQRFHSAAGIDTLNVLLKPAFFAPPGGFEPPSLV